MRIIERLSEVLTQRKQVQELEEARAFAMSIVETVREPLVILDDNLRVKSANHSFYQIFQVSKEDLNEVASAFGCCHGRFACGTMTAMLLSRLNLERTCHPARCSFHGHDRSFSISR